MGYLHIDNLYKNQTILLFKECYALEKLHGTSSHLTWCDNQLTYFSGGEKYANFVALFNHDALVEKFKQIAYSNNITIYGEAYGGKQQRQAWRYGHDLKFCAFDVKINNNWLSVPSAERFVKDLGLEFVYYKQVSTTIEVLDAERDAPSEQACRNGIEGDKPREGVVLRPLIEMRVSEEKRVIAKHKRKEEIETKKEREVTPEQQEVLTKANEIAEEWVTPIRLEHVLDALVKNGLDPQMKDLGVIINAMTHDVYREAENEITPSKDVARAIGQKTCKLFNQRCQLLLHNRADLWPGFIKE